MGDWAYKLMDGWLGVCECIDGWVHVRVYGCMAGRANGCVCDYVCRITYFLMTADKLIKLVESILVVAVTAIPVSKAKPRPQVGQGAYGHPSPH